MGFYPDRSLVYACLPLIYVLMDFSCIYEACFSGILKFRAANDPSRALKFSCSARSKLA